MFSTATKTTITSPVVQQKTTATFFRKAGEEIFFGAKESPSFFGKPIQAKLTVSTPDDPHKKEADTGIGSIQTKLSMWESNDKYEQEANITADKVVRRLSEPPTPLQPNVKPLGKHVSQFLQQKNTINEREERLQKKEDKDNLLKEESPQKSFIEGSGKSLDDTIQCNAVAGAQKEKIQTKTEKNSLDIASSDIESSLSSTKGSGSPLPPNTLQQMESSFGADFSNVRIHTNSGAVQMNKDLGAHAFTHGPDFYLNNGKYNPNSSVSKHLLAHELTHVIQKGEAGIQKKGNGFSEVISKTANKSIQALPA